MIKDFKSMISIKIIPDVDESLYSWHYKRINGKRYDIEFKFKESISNKVIQIEFIKREEFVDVDGNILFTQYIEMNLPNIIIYSQSTIEMT